MWVKLSATGWTNSGTLTIANNLGGIQLGVAGNSWANTGTIVVSGTAAELADNDDVQRAYLGL